MATLLKAGAQKTAANSKKETRKATPKLVCIITGQARFTNQDYLDTKVATAGSVDRFVKHYICADAMKMIRAGSTPAEIRNKLKKGMDLPMPSEGVMKAAMEINGKRARKEKTAKPAKAPAKKAAPKTAPAKKSEPTPVAPAAPTTPPAVS